MKNNQVIQIINNCNGNILLHKPFQKLIISIIQQWTKLGKFIRREAEASKSNLRPSSRQKEKEGHQKLK